MLTGSLTSSEKRYPVSTRVVHTRPRTVFGVLSHCSSLRAVVHGATCRVHSHHSISSTPSRSSRMRDMVSQTQNRCNALEAEQADVARWSVSDTCRARILSPIAALVQHTCPQVAELAGRYECSVASAVIEYLLLNVDVSRLQACIFTSRRVRWVNLRRNVNCQKKQQQIRRAHDTFESCV